VRIHNTVADATLGNDPKVKLTNEYNHASMRHAKEEASQRWLMYSKFCYNEATQKRARGYKHDSK
jgi:hypothetical protein